MTTMTIGDSVAAMSFSAWSILWVWATIIGLIVGVMYLLAPIGIKRSLYQRARPQFAPLRPEDIPDFAREFIAGIVSKCAELGFVAAESLRTVEHVPETSASVTILESRQRGECCQLICSWGSFSFIRSAHINIISEFPDGHRIITSSVTTGIFPPDRTCSVVIVPGMNRPALLVELHHRQRAQVSGERAVLPEPGKWIEYMTDEHIRELERVADAGYFVLDAQGLQYEPTWKGAYLMTWRLLPPVKQLKLLWRWVKGRLALWSMGLKVSDFPE